MAYDNQQAYYQNLIKSGSDTSASPEARGNAAWAKAQPDYNAGYIGTPPQRPQVPGMIYADPSAPPQGQPDPNIVRNPPPSPHNVPGMMYPTNTPDSPSARTVNGLTPPPSPQTPGMMYTTSSSTPTPASPFGTADQYKAAADAWKKANWGPNGTANGATESQNLAAVINQPGNTAINDPTKHAYLQSVLDQAAKDTAAQQPPAPTTTPVSSGGGANYSTNNLTDTSMNGKSSYSQQLMDSYNKLVGSLDPSSHYWDAYHQTANALGQKLFDSQHAGYQNTINQLNSLKQNQLNTGQNALTDKGFQNYLTTRQGMANKNLSGSGIAADADFRLQLANAQNLQNLYSRADATFDPRIADNTTKMGLLNKDQITAEQFQNMFSAASKNNVSALRDTGQTLGKTMPYDFTSQADQLKNSQFQDSLQQKYAGLNQKAQANELTNNTKIATTGMNNQSRETIAGMNNSTAMKKAAMTYNLDMTKIMGTDQQGNPTLDAGKLMEQMRHNRATEGITSSHNSVMESVARQNAGTNAENANINLRKAIDTANYHKNDMDIRTAELQDSHYAKQATEVNSQYNISKTEFDSAVKEKENLLNRYKNTISGGTLALSSEDKANIANLDKAIAKAGNDMDASYKALAFIRKSDSQNPLGGNYDDLNFDSNDSNDSAE